MNDNTTLTMRYLVSFRTTIPLLILVFLGGGVGVCLGGNPSAGPKPLGLTEKGAGHLQVFSSTERHQDSESLCYYPHTDYAIFDSFGKRLRWVRNGGPTDEQPSTITLSEGKYTVWARSDCAGMVSIPIVIKPGLLTNLYLEKSNRKPAPKAKVFRLPGGEVIGYASQ